LQQLATLKTGNKQGTNENKERTKKLGLEKT
jgi:hypothetical protein